MLPASIISLEQIIIIIAFLGMLIAALAFFKNKGGRIRANLHGDKRIRLVEETAVSPTERLRLITVDGQGFLMVSAKGAPPSLTPLSGAVQVQQTARHTPQTPAQAVPTGEQAEDVRRADEAGKPLELTEKLGPAAADSAADAEADIAAFSQKFRSWRAR